MLPFLYKLFPFDLKGDLSEFAPRSDTIRISCIINFYGRLDLLSGIMHSLAQQDLSRHLFEVVLVEDRGGTVEGRAFCEAFSEQLNIRYFPLDKNYGRMGYSRNFGLARAKGEIILFLDDDTVLLQPFFLSRLIEAFDDNREVDALIPHGSASFGLIKDKYDFHDSFFMTSRCMAYRRDVLEDLGGFVSEFVGQEDVEFVVRFHLASKTVISLADLGYHHPPLLVPRLSKPMVVGLSFSQLRRRYPKILFLLVGINCSRHMFLIFSPTRKHREMGKFGIGFLCGFVRGFFRCELQGHYR
ncbi:glycosyltransferase family 2 protein [Geothermobacter hydrogeniphilus]|uniref:Glycosyltransferase family 2 protein n=1 Tax=Geothermobacter hydrogeniphilus TaxID=1969733 RepID=A0A2K2H7C5_9BACT|nr:glycosyltransferase family 2 protein [Geothermobacter hydrogeniphilus]